MIVRQSGSVLSAALALAAEDPEVGPIKLRKGWSGSVTPVPNGGAERDLGLTSPAGHAIVLRRFAAGRERPEMYPASMVFLEGHTVWAGACEQGSGAVWITPDDPFSVAASAVSESIEAGWDLESSANIAGLFGSPALKSIVLTRGAVRRGISIVSGHVALVDLPNES